MGVLIDNLQENHPIPVETIRTKATVVLNALGCPDDELSLVIVDDTRMRELNRDYRGVDRPTNVLAFAMRDGEFADVTPDLLGDVIISTDTVRREADAEGVAFEAHFDRLMIHGILHLLGHDHQTDAEAEVMEAKTGELLALLSA